MIILTRNTTLEDVVILDQTLEPIEDPRMIDLAIKMIDIDQKEEGQIAGPSQAAILDRIPDLILDQTLDIDHIIDHHQLTIVLNPMTDHLGMIPVVMTVVTGPDMTNIKSHMTNPPITGRVKMTELERIIDQTTRMIEITVVLENNQIKRTHRITNLEVLLEPQITEANLEIDPLEDTTTGTDLEIILEIETGMSPETSPETSQRTSLGITLETNPGAVKDPLEVTPLWK